MNIGASLAMAIPFFETPTFDEVVFADASGERRLGFDEFRALPLRDRVHLLLSKPARFFMAGREVPRVEAMRFRG